MPLENTVWQDYSFDESVFVRFLDRTDFTLAKYHKLSLKGFSCFCSRPLKIGEVSQVEVNLKMITKGDIDDTEPHIATAELTGFYEVGGKQVCQFKFIDFNDNCLENLLKALVFLDSKEPFVPLPVTLNIPGNNPQSIDDIVKDIIEKTKTGQFVLPVLPKIVREIETLFQKPDTTAEDLAMIIERDAVIAVKVLATANSPFYRSDTHIDSIHETVVRLGFKVTRNLILTIANKSIYQVKNKLFGQFIQKLWKHSLTTAHCAKAIAEEKRFLNPDLFYTAGLVHDIGKTILFRFLGEVLTNNNPFNEQEVFECTERHSPEMSDTILRHWGFPDKFVNAVTMEHNDNINDGANKVSLVIDAANMMTRNMGYDLLDEGVDLSTLDSVKLLDMDLNTLNKIIENVKTMVESSENIF